MWGRAFSRICLFVCLFVRALKVKRLELCTETVDIQSTAGPRHALTLRSKGQISNLNPKPRVRVLIFAMGTGRHAEQRQCACRYNCNAAGGRTGRPPGAWAVGRQTMQGGPVRLRPVRATPCFSSNLRCERSNEERCSSFGKELISRATVAYAVPGSVMGTSMQQSQC